jgi:RNA polymerase sigma factor (sigma-70 family)
MADGVVGFVRRLSGPGATDRELLARFVAGRDEAAFEALVGRHARRVRAAAARVLADPADVDDATQATFLVLLRRAGRPDWHTALGPWLSGVAHRVAVKLRARRRRPASLDAGPPDPAPPPDPGWREACDLLHAELDRLPDRYRLPLLLCYLEGRTRDEAAAALGVSVGTVKGRVRRGCDLLRRRLARRGVSLSVGLVAAVAGPRPAGACSPATLAAAVRGAPSPRAAELAQEITRAMTPASNKLVLLGFVAAVGLVAAAGLVAGFDPVPAPRPMFVVAPVPKAAPPSVFVMRGSGLTFLDDRGEVKEKWATPLVGCYVALSRDGRRVAAVEYDGRRLNLVIRSRPGQEEVATVPLVCSEPGTAGFGAAPVWSPDGKRVMISDRGGDGKGNAYRVYDLAARSLTDVKLPDGTWVTGWSADGKRFLADVRPTGSAVRVAWLNADGTGKPEFVSPEGEVGSGGRLSPDGRRVLYLGGPVPPDKGRAKVRLYAQDLATGKRTAADEPGETWGYCWSPDGTRVAYTWQRSLDKPAPYGAELETLLITVDPDGRNRTVVTTRKAPAPIPFPGSSGVMYFFSVVDWR